jgi:hypothetical protein
MGIEPRYRTLECPSALHWLEGHRDGLCGSVVTRDALFSLLLLAFGLVGAWLAVFAGRRRNGLVEAWLAQGAADGHDITYIEPPEALEDRVREWWRGASRRRRLQLVGIAIVVGTVVLLPPYAPSVPWRWLTDRVPWQIANAVPWAVPTRAIRATAGSCGSNAIEPADQHPTIFVIVHGREWDSAPLDGGESGNLGTFRQLDRTDGVFTPDGGHDPSVTLHPHRRVFCAV